VPQLGLLEIVSKLWLVACRESTCGEDGGRDDKWGEGRQTEAATELEVEDADDEEQASAQGILSRWSGSLRNSSHHLLFK